MSRMHENPCSHRKASCTWCDAGERKHNWPENRRILSRGPKKAFRLSQSNFTHHSLCQENIPVKITAMGLKKKLNAKRLHNIINSGGSNLESSRSNCSVLVKRKVVDASNSTTAQTNNQTVGAFTQRATTPQLLVTTNQMP